MVYILTADHVADGRKRARVATFGAGPRPKSAAGCRSAEFIARSAEPELAVPRLTTRDEMPRSVGVCPPSGLPQAKEVRALPVGCGRARMALTTRHGLG